MIVLDTEFFKRSSVVVTAMVSFHGQEIYSSNPIRMFMDELCIEDSKEESPNKKVSK